MTKYHRITSWLRSSNSEPVAAKFQEIEAVTGFPCPLLLEPIVLGGGMSMCTIAILIADLGLTQARRLKM